MATNRWLDVDSDWTNTSNWSVGAAPVSTDDVIIDDGNKDIDTNLGQAAVDLTSIKVGAGYTGNLGAAGNTLRIGAGTVHIANPGDCYIEGATTKALDDITVDRPNADTICYIDGYMADLTFLRGRIQLGASGNSDGSIVVRSMYRDVLDTDVILTISAGITDLTTVEQKGGQLTFSTAPTTYTIEGGRAFHRNGAITTCNVSAGTFFYEADETITTLNARGGRFDGTRNKASTSTPTITNVYRWPGATIDVRTGTGVISLGSSTKKDYSPGQHGGILEDL